MTPLFMIYAVLLLPWIGVSCGAIDTAHDLLQTTVSDSSLHSARTFLIQLQNLDIEAIRRADPDVVVVDYSFDGSEQHELTRKDVERLKERPGRPRIVLAYMSIGEAETYRFYWNDIKRLAVAENKAWPGNYRVRYWDPAWSSVLVEGPRSYLGRILAAGFDGVFLDTVDIAEWFLEKGKKDAAEHMADLIVRISDRARSQRKGFIVVAQNAFVVLDRPDVIAALSGVSGEALFFKNDRLIKSELNKLDIFRNLKDKGKVVILIEYVKSPVSRSQFQELCKGFLCYIGPRSLGRVGQLFEKVEGQDYEAKP